MKKLALTIAIVLGLGMTTFADPNNGGLFQRGAEPREYATRDGADIPLLLPNHNQTSDQTAPIGTGIALLTTLGAAYWAAKRREQE